MGFFSDLSSDVSNSFISDISEGFGSAINNTLSGLGNVIPIWAGQQLGLQQKDQLSNPTVQTDGTQQTNLTTETNASKPSTVTPVSANGGVSIFGTTIPTIWLIGIGAGTVAMYYWMKK